jgi:xylan 1,4-beta-xylosidase
LDGTVELEMDAPLPPQHPWSSTEPLRDDFNESDPGIHWNWLRNPVLEWYSTTVRPGWLRLSGSPATLDDQASPTFLARRQRWFNCRAATLVDFQPQAENEEAGLAVLGDNNHHYEIGITTESGERIVFVRRRIGTLQAVVARRPVKDGLVKLSLKADKTWYTFSCAVGEEPLTELASGEARYLCTEAGAAVFTGVFLGLYATGNGERCQTPADFSFFEIEVGEQD